jgi:hypothetical protein
MNKMWSKYISKMNIVETIKSLAEGIAFILILVMMYFMVMVGCAMLDRCYNYYVPGVLS